MAKNKWLVPAGIIILAIYLLQSGTINLGGSGEGDDDSVGTVPGGCGIDSSFTLAAQDKFDTAVNVGAAHKYKINDGPTSTYSASVTAKQGDKITILWGAGNETIYNQIETKKIEACGPNPLTIKTMVQNTSVTVECFDENNDKIDGTTYNYTIGSGESATIPCRLKIDTNKKGLPYGGIIVAELATGTTYKEEVTSLDGGVIGSSVSVPGAYTLAAAANKAVAFEVNDIMTTGYKDFNLYVEAESGQDPTGVGSANNILLKVYSEDCYENSDTGDFECGVVDEDNNWAGDLVGSATVHID